MTEDTKTRRPVGRPRKLPEDATGQLAIRIKDTDRKVLRELADTANISLSAYIVEVLRAHLDETALR